MRFTVSKSSFQQTLKKCIGAIDNRVTLPALSCFRITARNGAVAVDATNLSMHINATIQGAQVESGGSTLIAARKLAQIVGALPDGDVLFCTDAKDGQGADGAAEKAIVQSGKAKYSLNCMDAAEYPPLEGGELSDMFTVRAGELTRCIALVDYAASTDETRRQLNSVLLSLRGGALTVAATDGRRLAVSEIAVGGIDGQDGREADAILPVAFASGLARMIDGEEDSTMRVSANASVMRFTLQNSVVMTKLIEGSYPNFRQVIPNETNGGTARVQRQALLDAIGRVSMIADGVASVAVRFTGEQVVAKANSAMFGEAVDVLDAGFSGGDLTIAFNPTFIMEPLRAMDSDIAEVRFTDEAGPCIITDNAGFLYVVMPMRN